jgi:tetratricopeptide (TPR) repeat protein
MGMSTGRNQILWVAEVSPATRVGRAYLPLRPGAEENAERAWLRLPEPVRAQIELVGGFEAEPEDGPIDAEAWFVGVWLAEPMVMAEVQAGLRALAPFMLDARLLIGSPRWIEALRISDRTVAGARTRVKRLFQLGHLAHEVAAAPADAALRRVCARLHREAARGALAGWVWRVERRPGDLQGHGGASEAQSRLDVAADLDPDDAQTWELRGCLARALGEAAAAREAFTRALALGGDGLAVRLGLAEQAQAAGALASAAEHLQAAAGLPGAPVDIHHRLGLTLHNLGRLDEAIAQYDRSIASRPQRASGSKLNLGNAHAARKDWRAALACYDAAIAEAPNMALAWGGRGQALRNLGRLAEAGAALDRAVALDPSFASFWLELATLHFADGERAVRLCDEALARDPNCAYSWSTKGSALNNLGRHAEAEACLTRSIELKPDYGHPWYCRACSFALQGRTDEALAAAARALELDPSWRAGMRGESDLISLRDDPRFVALMRG